MSAYLLKKQGYDLIGLFMKNWEEDGLCPSSKDYQDVISICDQLNIPYYSMNFTKEYEEEVFLPFLEECKKGKTPNPDILCNSEIKFQIFLKKALQIGDFLATGHYCNIDKKNLHLLRGNDPNKDQSYFLHAIERTTLKNVLFPIGELLKPTVRELAKEANFSVYQKKDSTGICFIGKRNFKEFVSSYLGFSPGEMRSYSGKYLGSHEGLAYYTIGQRKGLGIGGRGEAWYVAEKDVQNNILYIVQGEKHPALYADALTVEKIHWLTDRPSFPLQCTAKVRYRSMDKPCIISKKEEAYIVRFQEPQRAITEGQSVVFYQKEICLGGGVITSSGASYYHQEKELF